MKYVDLSTPFEPGMATLPYPQHAITEFTRTGRIRMEGSNAHKVTFGTHAGTHIDSPFHMIDGSNFTVDKIPLDRLFVKAKLLKIDKKENEIITLDEVEKSNVKKGEALIISTGWWDKNYGYKSFYLDFPTMEDEAVDYLVKTGIGILGLDTPSPDLISRLPGDPKKNYIHKQMLNNNIFIIETLANLRKIEVEEFQLVALPLKAMGLDGFPVRAVAIY